MARLRGALTVIVGIQPDVAIAMVMLGMETGSVDTALDLEEGLAHLNSRVGTTVGTAMGTIVGTAVGPALGPVLGLGR
jgi:rsbT antagonist protein RsbS